MQVHDIDVEENPFTGYKIGQTVTARIVAKPNKSESHRKGSQWELSVRPKMLSGFVYAITFYLFKLS